MIGKLRFLIAVIVGKISAFLLDKIFKSGTDTSGIIILKNVPMRCDFCIGIFTKMQETMSQHSFFVIIRH